MKTGEGKGTASGLEIRTLNRASVRLAKLVKKSIFHSSCLGELNCRTFFHRIKSRLIALFLKVVNCVCDVVFVHVVINNRVLPS